MILPTTVPSLTVYASWNSATDRAQVSHLSIPLCRVQIPSPGSDCWAGLHWGKELAVIWIPRSISGQSLRMVYGLWMLMVCVQHMIFAGFWPKMAKGWQTDAGDVTSKIHGQIVEICDGETCTMRARLQCVCVCVCFFSCCDFEWVRALCKA